MVGARKSLGWADEPPEVQEALWLTARLRGVTDRLRDPKLSENERARLLASVRAASQAMSGTDATALRDRLRVLLDEVALVSLDTPHVVRSHEPGRRQKIAAMLRTGLESALGPMHVADDLLVNAVDGWSRGGGRKWDALLPLAKAAGAVSAKVTAKSLGERASRILGER